MADTTLNPARCRVWRLILHGEQNPAWNMAVDEAILDAVGAGIAPPTLRLYTWSAMSISVGRFQSISKTINRQACAAMEVQILRRPTGGRGVLHGTDQTLSVALQSSDLPVAGSIPGIYRYLGGGIRVALEALGVAIAAPPIQARNAGAGDCFADVSQLDLVASSGDKLIGSALCRRGSAILMQSSIRHFEPSDAYDVLFVGASSPRSYPLEEVDDETLSAALVRGFESALQVRCRESDLTDWELERAAYLLPRT